MSFIRRRIVSLTGYHRLHLICGESFDPRLPWLKVATTRAGVAMAEGGIHLSSAAAELRDPRQAMLQMPLIRKKMQYS